ncbi:MAG: iron ABC transporter permease [Sphaerochaetaceae bacterium]|jgi:iron(III) transport system permease protein|nr:iron ABC transporter permease [Spirochaetales bacterium]MDY5500494.1 iron ABC transporter permease [Sphaerochaetaceae bacterium]
MCVVLAYLTLLPMLSMIRDTVTVHVAETMRLKKPVGSFTWEHWRKVLFDASSLSIFYRPLWNSLVTSLGSCLFALAFGGFFAWLVTRTNMRWKRSLSALFIFPYIMPSWTIALAWYNVFKNTVVGGVPGFFTAVTGLETPNWFAYGAFPIALVTGIHYSPFAYIMIGGILRNMDANLEEAAMMLHASQGRIMRKITIPMVLPAILSTFLLVFSSAMSSFAVPQFLGLPVRYQVLTTQLFRTLNGLNPGQGYCIAMVMILLGVAILAFNQRLTGVRKNYTTITGKSSNISLINLRGLRTPLSVIVLVAVVAVSVLPLVSFAFESILLVPGDYSLHNLTLQFWIGTAEQNSIANSEPGLLRNSSLWFALWNSIRLSVVCSLSAGILGFLAGYAIVRGRGTRLATVVDNLAFFPYLMPSMAFGAIYLSMFSTRNGIIPSLYGTFFLLVLIGTVKYMPFASRSGINAMMQLSTQIEEAGEIIGIGWFKRMRRLVIPIQKASFLSGFLLPFISCMRELSLFVLLVTPNNRVLTTLLFYYNEKGWSQYSNGINLLIVLIVLLINWAVNKATGASIDKGIGG